MFSPKALLNSYLPILGGGSGPVHENRHHTTQVQGGQRGQTGPGFAVPRDRDRGVVYEKIDVLQDVLSSALFSQYDYPADTRYSAEGEAG